MCIEGSCDVLWQSRPTLSRGQIKNQQNSARSKPKRTTFKEPFKVNVVKCGDRDNYI